MPVLIVGKFPPVVLDVIVTTSALVGTPLGLQLLLVAQTVLPAPVHDLSVANADWLIRSMATAMIWMVMTNTPLGHLLDTCELIVEKNFTRGCFLVRLLL